MLFGKKKKSFADKYFFDEVKKTTAELDKEFKQTNDYVKDIDNWKAIFEEKETPEVVAKYLFFREDNPLITTIRQIAIIYNNKGVIVSEKQLDKLFDSNVLIYDRALEFIKYLLSIKVKVNGRREFFDMKYMFCKNMYAMEKNRVNYLKKITKGSNINTNEFDYQLDSFLKVLKDCIKKNPTEDIISVILLTIRYLPEDYYEKMV